MASSYLRGALIEFIPTVLIPVPNVIIFQYNPETITHGFTPATSAKAAGNPLAVSGMPGETFSFTLLLDANDQIGEGDPLTISTGIYSRLAALEMLLFPAAAGTAAGLLGTVSVATQPAGASAATGQAGGSGPATAPPAVPISNLPTVLFIWGPGRIAPVRVTQLSVTEKLFDPLLNPIHAEAQIGLQVLTPEELANVSGPLASVAKAAYAYTQGKRLALAVANLANSVESTIGMIPV